MITKRIKPLNRILAIKLLFAMMFVTMPITANAEALTGLSLQTGSGNANAGLSVPSNGSTTLMTDGKENTSFVLDGFDRVLTNKAMAWYVFPTATGINQYRIVGTAGGPNLQIGAQQSVGPNAGNYYYALVNNPIADGQWHFFPTGTGGYHGSLIRVAIRNQDPTSATISEFDVRLLNTVAPSTPTGVTATENGTSITLNWTTSTDDYGVSGYNVYRDGVRVNVALVTGPNYTDSSVKSGTTYSYTVEALDGSGNSSAKSAVVTATTATTGSEISLVRGGNTLVPKMVIINYAEPKSVNSSDLLPYSYSRVTK
jgi:hypothetical protein